MREVDAAGGVSVFERDPDGLVVAESAPDGTAVEVRYAPLGMATRVVDGAGRVTEVEVDAAGNVLAVTGPAGDVTSYTYDYRASGTVLASVTGASGAVTEVECDAAGRPVRVFEPGGRVFSYGYDAFGHLTTVMDPDGNESRQVWSPAGELLERIHPDGTTERAEYDADGNVVAAIDEVGGRRRTHMGLMDVPVETVDAAGGRLRLRYDTQLQVREVINPDGLSWRFDYDHAGRLIGETDYNGAVTRYRVDAAGRVISRTDALGRTTTSVYDVAGRVVAQDSESDGRTEFRYGPTGELVEAANPDAVVSFEHDDDTGMVTAETVNGITTGWTMDVRARRATRTVDTGDAVVAAGGRWTSVFGWDESGLLTELSTTSDGEGAHAAVDGLRFGYNLAGLEVSRAIGSRAQLTQRFDRRSRLTEQVVHTIAAATGSEQAAASSSVGRSGAAVAGRRWSYRADTYVTRLDDAVAGSTTFGLDADGRVLSATGGAGGVGAERFAYSPAGILTAASGGAGVAGVASSPTAGPAATDRDGRVTHSGTLVTRVGRDRFVYDAAGQMIERHHHRLSRKPEITRFTYTSRGQIRTVEAPDGTRWRYGYDAFGRRVWKTHTTADGDVVDTVVFGWDGDDLVCQTNTAHTPRAGTAAGAATTWVWTYHPDTHEPLEQHTRHATPATPDPAPDARGGDGVGAAGDPGQWSQARIDDEFHAIVSDLADTPTELIDPATGQVAGRATHTVWGSTVWVGVSTPLRFAGQQHDPETGLHYNRYRYYNPATTTYTSPDPLGVNPNPASATAYVHNPYIWIDPLGLTCKKSLLANKLNGDAFRDRIAKVVPGSRKELSFMKAPFGPRRYDVASGGLAPDVIETKVGRVFFSRSIRQQISNDVALLNSGQVSSVTWMFEKSPITGRLGGSKRVMQSLDAGGINTVLKF
ncbi:hypothetical protein GCM10009624_36250 [Gordonia sinesedis]